LSVNLTNYVFFLHLRGPSNNYYLGHFKNNDDDDDDDDRPYRTATLWLSQVRILRWFMVFKAEPEKT